MYNIDRWLSQTGEGFGAITLDADGLTIDRFGEFYNIGQPFDAQASGLAGKTVTFSILEYNMTMAARIIATAGDNYWGVELLDVRGEVGSSSLEEVGLSSVTATIPQNAKYVMFMMSNDNGVGMVGSAVIQAVKAEIGAEQTLAHQDSSGNWVLNDPPPNYQQELAKCQRYQVVLNTDSDFFCNFGIAQGFNNTCAIALLSLPVSLRARPSISKQGILALEVNQNSYAVTGVACNTWSGNNLAVSVYGENLDATEIFKFRSNDTEGRLIIDANL